MTTKTKAPNYTAELAATLVARYVAAMGDEGRKEAVAEMAVEFNRTPASIRSKLVKEGVYRKAPRKGKNGGVKKADVVTAIAAMVPMADNDAESLTKATMRALGAIRSALTATAEDEAEAETEA